MHLPFFLILATIPFTNTYLFPSLHSLDEVPVLHLPLQRRGGGFSTFQNGSDVANLTVLRAELTKACRRFNRTKREVKGNRVVRKAKGMTGDGEEGLLGDVAETGGW